MDKCIKNCDNGCKFSSCVQAIVKDNARVDTLCVGDYGLILTKNTPFFPELGGVCGDQGILRCQNSVFVVKNTICTQNNLVLHEGQLQSGKIKVGDTVCMIVDLRHNNLLRSHHTATHLLNAVLRSYFGDQVVQKGSRVCSANLRFDFNHDKIVTAEDIRAIESQVNDIIRQQAIVNICIMSFDEAMALNAQAVFRHKYGDTVRVVSIGDKNNEVFSVELCGGIHVHNTRDIQVFRIISLQSIASGIKRIEACAGDSALDYLLSKARELENIIKVVNDPHDVVSAVASLSETNKSLCKKNILLKAQLLLYKNVIHEKCGDDCSFIVSFATDSTEKEVMQQIKTIKFSGVLVILLQLSRDDMYVIYFLVQRVSLSAVSLLNDFMQGISFKGGGNNKLAHASFVASYNDIMDRSQAVLRKIQKSYL